MNVHQVKFLTWLGAVGLTAGLGYYVYSYTTGLETRADPFDFELAEKILKAEYEIETLKVDLVDVRQVQAVFHDLNWTGREAPKPVERPKDTVTQSRITPVADLIDVVLVLQDSDRPEGSSAYVLYKPKAGVKDAPVAGVTLKVGHRLAEPHAYARIEKIDVYDGVTFAFDDEARPLETVQARNYDPQTTIPVAEGDGAILRQRSDIPRYEGPGLTPPPRTKLVGKDHYQLGVEDMYMFGDDYAEIIAREVRHRRHKDPKTGRYDGIELQDVKAGGVVAGHGGMSGDVIKSINGQPVTSVSEAITFVKNNKDKYTDWIVVVENMGRQRTLRYDSPPQMNQ